MKNTLLGLLIILSTNLKGQDFQDNFSIGKFLKFYDNDSISFYYSKVGNIVERSRADFFRIGKIDSVNINVSGKFRDFYINGHIALDATMKDNSMDGLAIYYHENGKIKSTGNYKNDFKVGLWKYFYKNGQLEKIINFVNDGTPLFVDYYDKNGEQLVINGNGNYEGYFCSYKATYGYKIKGMLKDGLLDGKWSIYASSKIGDEYFENGVFKKGESMGYNYSDKQMINIIGYNPHEGLNLYDNLLGWSNNSSSLFFRSFNRDFPDKYLNIVSDSLNNSLKGILQNQWIFVSIKLKHINSREDIAVKSSINDKLTEDKIFNTLNEVNFDLIKKSSKDTNLDYFFTILIKNNMVVIPKDYIYKNK
ncbi:MAG TPA: hypothetical protein PK784_14085 [Tenuifilaceae bacterium]|nr:hypothetical protein [Tenuifilaceae bacterium]HPN21121.1 hypothetical protein [Tenuifilaceae bacterium]